MLVEVNVPLEFQGSCLSLVTHRDGVIMGMDFFLTFRFPGKKK